MAELKIPVSGLNCSDCAATIPHTLNTIPGVKSVKVDLGLGVVRVTGDVERYVIENQLAELGYPVRHVDSKAAALDFSGFWRYFWQMKELKLIIPGFILLGLTVLLPMWGVSGAWLPWLQLALLPVAGWPVFKNGFISLFLEKKLNINFLMSLAAIGAVFIGEAHEALLMLVLFTISEALEGFTNDKARAVLSEFADLAPKTAAKLVGDTEVSVPVEDLAVGDLISVKAGQRFPMDGVVTAGTSEVNQAPITGESRMVPKSVGDEVLSGTINGQGTLTLRITRLAQDNTIQRIIRLVTEAQATKAKQEKFIDRFANVYTPIVVLVAALVVIIPVAFLRQPFWNVAGEYGWLHRGLSLLMIGCPCALVISTPITIISALTRAAREGVVFKGGLYLENLSQAKAVALDKTGTLTLGKPMVSTVKAVDCVEPTTQNCEPCDNLVALASSLERQSSHPLGEAVLAEARNRGVLTRYEPALEARSLAGRGQEGWVNGKLATIGSLPLFEEAHHDHMPAAVRQGTVAAEANGQTTMLVCDGAQVLGFLAVQDQPRQEAKAVLADLRALGLRTFMLTGDNASAAKKIAEEVGVEDVHANLLPADKLNLLDQLKEKYGNVIMVGDGINDSPALAKADVGVAMGGANNAQVLETADVVLMNDSLDKLPYAIRLSKFTNSLIRQNIVISLGVKFLVAILAVLGLTPLWVAVMADIGISLAVTLNGMRALRFTPEKAALKG